MIDFDRMIIGTEEFNVPITCIDLVHDYIDLNNGCIIAYTFNKKDGYTFYYDKVGGPIIDPKATQLYIWNSQQVTKSGNRKRQFTITIRELKELIGWQLENLFEVNNDD